MRREPVLDFLSANHAKLKGAPDPEVLGMAAAQNRILVTHDIQTMPEHFGEFPTAQHTNPGVFLLSRLTPIGRVIEEPVLIWAASESDEWRNRIVKIPQP